MQHYRAVLTFYYRTPEMRLLRSKDVLVSGSFWTLQGAYRGAYYRVVNLASGFDSPVLVLRAEDPPAGEPSRGTLVVIRVYQEVPC